MEIPQGDRVRILMSYEAESMKLNFFPNQKGVAMMEITRNKDGEEVWDLYIEIDDRYRDLPINKYSMMGHMLILITDRSATTFSTDSLVRQERNKCLEKIVGSRLYQRNDRSDDVSVAYTPAGKVIWEKPGIPKMKRRGMWIMLGNAKNQTIITFKRDGTYTLQKSV
ncbi:hypothetical protein [Dyadobacter sp. 50-39]|uniref:hypothetical protein n=1 Tax=Dyadobacter sp. 50-39 TaxID=1895756 RepID=UPI0025BE8F38|nr:hypothetical protein [Dyadobacter sp. 50-39]